MSDPFLPYGRQSIDETDISSVAEVLRSDFLTTGPAVDEFEAAFAAAVGASHAISCSSGTAALHLAALALSLGEGDSVVVPSVTFVATANAARYVGSEVCFADVDPDTGLMTEATLSAALNQSGGAQPKALFPVHMNGQRCDMEAIAGIARAAGCAVVEDACHAVGNRDVGACEYSDMAVFSLHPVKTITSGEGGVVTTVNEELAGQVARFRNHGLVRDPAKFEIAVQAMDKEGEANPWYYEMPELGFNYRLSDIHAALGTSQLRKLDKFVERRQTLANRYDERLASLAPVVRPVPRAGTPALHLYVVLIDFEAVGRSRATVMQALREAGIGTQVHYLPVHRQPYYRRRYGDIQLPGADAYYARALSLPYYPDMSDADLDRVVESLALAIR